MTVAAITPLELFKQKRYTEATTACLAGLQADPTNVALLNLTAAIAHERGDLHEAGRWLDVALSHAADNAELWKNRGNVHRATGDPVSAEACLRRAVQVAPGYVVAHVTLARLLQTQGRIEDAVACLREAVRLDPKSPDWQNDLGLALLNLGCLKESEASLRQALALSPNHPEAHFNLGIVQAKLGDPAAAEMSYLRALAWRQDYVDALINLGNLLIDQDRTGEALVLLRRAVDCQPENALVLSNYGGLLWRLCRLEEAEAVLRRALVVLKGTLQEARGAGSAPADSDANPINMFAKSLAILGAVFMSIPGRLDEAADCFRQMHAVLSQEDDSIANKVHSTAVAKPGQSELTMGSQQYTDRGGEVARRQDEATYLLGFVHLLQGRFAEGWREYEARLNIFHESGPPFSFPQWQGESLEGRRILLVGEQGRGDQIQFIRYAALLRQLGAASVDVWPIFDLADLLSSVEGVGKIWPGLAEIAAETYDYWSLLLSVPRYVGTDLSNIPARVPYLKADPARGLHWAERLKVHGGGSAFRVGLVWAGNPEHPNDRFRSMSLEVLAPLLARRDIAWFSLQKGPAEEELPRFEIVRPLGPELNDYGDTAAVLENLDLVISVDTSVAHLAGALGRPVWVMLPANPDWRWLIDREDSPWYPTMRLFRQQRLGQWGEPIERVCKELAREASLQPN